MTFPPVGQCSDQRTGTVYVSPRGACIMYQWCLDAAQWQTVGFTGCSPASTNGTSSLAVIRIGRNGRSVLSGTDHYLQMFVLYLRHNGSGCFVMYQVVVCRVTDLRENLLSNHTVVYKWR